jgi:UDPglucose 6-dehydrogenase
MKIGFIGQGFIGKNYADDFENRGFVVVRYSQEEPFIHNKEKIKDCDIVFIAVPTPTTKKGFDYSIIENVIPCVGRGKIAVIKSTLLPGTTEKLQKKFKDIFVCHSPEFLREVTASFDAAHPERNIVGVVKLDKKGKENAQKILSVLPKAPFESVMSSREAEMVKYIGNCFLYTKVVFFNMMFDLVKKEKLDFDIIIDAVAKDSRIGASHTKVVHNSGHTKKVGRGAGGHCFIKDYEALLEFYKKHFGMDAGFKALYGYREKNNELLVKSKKDLELLEGVVGNIRKYNK